MVAERLIQDAEGKLPASAPPDSGADVSCPADNCSPCGSFPVVSQASLMLFIEMYNSRAN